jgi:hypothetical protein
MFDQDRPAADYEKTQLEVSWVFFFRISELGSGWAYASTFV